MSEVFGFRTGRGLYRLHLVRECSGTGSGMPRDIQVGEQNNFMSICLGFFFIYIAASFSKLVNSLLPENKGVPVL